VKPLVNPLLWFLLAQTTGLIALYRTSSGRRRTAVQALLVLTAMLAVASTELVLDGLETSLGRAEVADSAFAPAMIFVLGGGYIPSVSPDEDVLVQETEQRVAHGVAEWRRHPSARLVFSGAAYEYAKMRPVDQSVQLMAEAARMRGVPASAVILEARSRNTREHPIEARRIPTVTSETPVAVVTSAWHMRRARREFCRHFRHVLSAPVPTTTRSLGWGYLLPSAGSLEASTTLLREWVGLLWYQLRATMDHTPMLCVGSA
jgi:uncharacterized SAM-binding protein YcdF (DUF218 family)